MWLPRLAMARRWRDVARCAAYCSASAACGIGVSVRAHFFGIVRGLETSGTGFGSRARLRIAPEAPGLLKCEARRPAVVRQTSSKIGRAAALARGYPAMVSKSCSGAALASTRASENEMRGPPVACALRHNAGPSWLWPARRAARVWSAVIAERHSSRRRGAARSLTLADTHYPRRRCGAPFREKFHIFTRRHTQPRVAASHSLIYSPPPRARHASHRSLPHSRERAHDHIRRRPASASPTPSFKNSTASSSRRLVM